jgi:N-acetylneuraminic acid mutarotase
MYDPATNKWTSRAAIPNADQAGASGRAISGKLYVVGGFEDGYGNTGASGELYAYDPATDSWTNKANMPHPRGFLSAAAANGVLYAIGGLATPDVLGTNLAYSP